MLRIYNTDLNTNEFHKIQDFEIGCWVNLVNPTMDEINVVSSSLGIKKEFLVSILDDNEKPRIDEEEGCKMLLLDVPISNKNENREENIVFWMIFQKEK